MPQPPRIFVEPNSYYHIFNRGVNRRTIFKDNGDFQRFLTLVSKYLTPVGYLLSYALMPDHFHLTVLMKPAVEIHPKFLKDDRALGRTFGHLQNAYANYFNHKYETVSGLFEANFERKKIESLQYLRQLIVYHHLNPEKHGVELNFKHYFWTSFQEFANPMVKCNIAKDLALSKFDSIEAFFAAHGTDVPAPMAEYEFEHPPT